MVKAEQEAEVEAESETRITTPNSREDHPGIIVPTLADSFAFPLYICFGSELQAPRSNRPDLISQSILAQKISARASNSDS